jgi:hypothetical protein
MSLDIFDRFEPLLDQMLFLALSISMLKSPKRIDEHFGSSLI